MYLFSYALVWSATLTYTSSFIVQPQSPTSCRKTTSIRAPKQSHLLSNSLSSSTTSLNAFDFKLPSIDIPWFTNNAPTPTSSPTSQKSVLVIGGTGGIGQLVSKKMNQRGYNVRVAARNPSSASELLNDESNEDSDNTIDTCQLNVLDAPDQVQVNLMNAMKDVSAVVISLGTTAFPTQKWRGGNTPKAIDEDAIKAIAEAALETNKNGGKIEKVVLLTSIGVERTKEMPFLILNLFGVLDAKRAGEDAVKEASISANNGDEYNGFDYVIIRPGRLVGGPYTNLDLAKLLQVEGGAENGVTMEAGDTLIGDCKRDACAEAVCQTLESDECRNVEFSIVSNEDGSLTSDQWEEAFQSMK